MLAKLKFFKNMKKTVLFLSLVAFILASCGSDDDVNVLPQVDPIIGTWKYSMSLVDGVDQGLLPCENEETIVFNVDGTYLESFYIENMSGSCVFDESFPGIWENTGINTYNLVEGGDVSEFEIINNMLYYTLTFDNGTPSDTSDDFTESEVYVKQ